MANSEQGRSSIVLKQEWPRPSQPRPIVVIGAGGIVRDAHLPAYKKAGYNVCGITDIDPQKAQSVAQEWSVGEAFDSLSDAVATHGNDVVYDLAVPPAAVVDILDALPSKSTVLIQKPMGQNINEARQILALCRDRGLTAAVNFQLRFSPMMLGAADLIERGELGELLEIEFQVNIYTPWHLFPFLKAMERVEIAVHSIHYLDLIRSLAGDPVGVLARTMADPRAPDYRQTRTSAILDYGPNLRVLVNTNHNHRGGNKFQVARLRIEGSKGSVFVKLGVLYDYPKGAADELWFCRNDGNWQAVDLAGTWFPDAFIGVMSNLQRFAAGEDNALITDVSDAFRTMALVEACYAANERAGTPLVKR